MQRFLQRTMKILLVDKPQRRAEVADILLKESVKSRRLSAGDDPIKSPDECCVYKLFEASSSAAAQSIFKMQHPDLVLLANHSDIEGTRELTLAIRQEEKERRTGIVFFGPDVTSGGGYTAIECFEMGADDVIISGSLGGELIARINAVLRLKSITDELRVANHRLELLSLTDELTGLANMRSFHGYYQSAMASCMAGDISLAVIMMDLDNFKKINDCSNHLMGSHIIAEVGKLIKYSRVFPPTFCPARYGGDEYVIACCQVSRAEVYESAEALRRLIEKAVFKKDDHSIAVTASIGICFVAPGFVGAIDGPIKVADLMLYESKHKGRNQVSIYDLCAENDFHLTEAETSIMGKSQLENSVIINNIKLYK